MRSPSRIREHITTALLVFFSAAFLRAQGIYFDFGKKNTAHYLELAGNIPAGDGEVISAFIKPEYCGQSAGHAIYFAIDDPFLYQRPEGTFNIINIEYFDAAEREIKLIYDSRDDADKTYEPSIRTAGTMSWKSASFFLDDAWFGNRQANRADFRLECADTMSINVVRVAPVDYYIDFGETNDEFFISQKEIQGGDSKTEIRIQDGLECITATAADQYLYCDVDDQKLAEGNYPEFFVSVEYYDSDPLLTMRLQYDSAENPYKDTSSIQGKGWGSFKTYSWEVFDGMLGGRQNGMSDFRLHLQRPGLLVNRIALGYLDYGPSGVEGNAGASPVDFRLDQNFPNPFNPSTSVAYRIGRPGAVSLDIFDLKGGKVRTLAGGPQPAGMHRVMWDGLDDRGREVPSGQYVCRCVSGGFARSIKMIRMN
jgi:hypothetical protein